MIEVLLYVFVTFQILFLLALWKGRHFEAPALTQEEIDYAKQYRTVKKDQVFYGQECLQEEIDYAKQYRTVKKDQVFYGQECLQE